MKMQCFVKSAACLVLQAALGVSFILSHRRRSRLPESARARALILPNPIEVVQLRVANGARSGASRGCRVVLIWGEGRRCAASTVTEGTPRPSKRPGKGARSVRGVTIKQGPRSVDSWSHGG